MSLLPLRQVLFMLFFLTSLCKANQIRVLETIQNAEFENKKITELPITTGKVLNKEECVVLCTQTSPCLSFSYNGNSMDCTIFDKDFVHVTDTQTTDEIGWGYYYVQQPAGVLDKSKCELQVTTPGICHNSCLFYRRKVTPDTVPDLVQKCADGGGEVIKVDRYLKHYCMGLAVDNVIGLDGMTINGQQDITTGEWTYFDGTKMTYYDWHTDYHIPQPEYISPTATPGKYQGYIGTKKQFKYRLHDAPDSWLKSVLREVV